MSHRKGVVLPLRVPLEEVDRRFKERGLVRVEPYVNASTPCKVRCAKGHVTSQTLNRLNNRPTAGCTPCNRLNRISPKRLSVDVAEERLRSYGFEPLGSYVDVDTRWRAYCAECGEIVYPILSSLSRGATCVECKKLEGSPKRLSDDHALAVMRRGRYEPLVPYETSGTKWLSRCMDCEEERTPTYDNVKQGYLCPCHKHGFKYRKPTYVYLIFHPAGGALKVGVTQALRSRRKGLKKYGFDLESMELFLFPTGTLALDIEDAVLASWRVDGIPEALPSSIIGYTETAALSQVSVNEARNLIQSHLEGVLDAAA